MVQNNSETTACETTGLTESLGFKLASPPEGIPASGTWAFQYDDRDQEILKVYVHLSTDPPKDQSPPIQPVSVDLYGCTDSDGVSNIIMWLNLIKAKMEMKKEKKKNT